MVSHIFLLQDFVSFEERPTRKWTNEPLSFPTNYQNVLALAFAVKEVNENNQILPNVTLGFRILLNRYDLGSMTYKATLDLISTPDKFAPNFKCDVQENLMSVIGASVSETSVHMATILASYKMPQFTYGSVSSVQGKKTLFPYMYKMVPNDSFQYMGVVQLLHHFNWTWIGLFAVDDENGDTFLQTVISLLSRNRICYDFTLRTPKRTDMVHLLDLFSNTWGKYQVLVDSKANVYFAHGQPTLMHTLRMLLFMVEEYASLPLGKVWITTSHWAFQSVSLQRIWDTQICHGAISFAIHSNQPPDFQKFLQIVKPSWAKGDGFIQEFWEKAFDCSLKISEERKETKRPCTGEEKLESLPGTLFEMSMTGQSYNIYNAVHAVARSLHATYRLRDRSRILREGQRLESQNVQPWELHHFLRIISFNNSAGDLVRFDDNGELIAGFDVTNWITFPNSSFARVKVGRLDPQAPPGKELTLHDDQMVWHTNFNQVEYMDACVRCLENAYPNKDRNECIPRIVNYLSYHEPIGIALAVLVISFSLMTSLVLGTFLKHRDTPIVKANNLNLSYLLLISLLLCFLCSFLFIGQPGKLTCLLRQTAFGIIFSVALSSVLAKTITVILAFMATIPGSTMRKLVGKRMANFIVLLCPSVQAIICIFWLSTFPPFPDRDTSSLNTNIILQCNEGSPTMFYCVLGYLVFLAFVSFAVAFLARKLPEKFNETKLITFSMLVFCSVWLCFVPTYLSTKGKYMAAVEIFSILASGAGLLGCIFSPKCYIIVLRPTLNHKGMVKRTN
ncbi:vomeronasal type-2 receptor 26-like [Paroedura picta]|uniref:vomeronasal type-2 receptor 26-like n=1 Tax=Paroedura picta TaxID=143630 RepID=UPI004056D761